MTFTVISRSLISGNLHSEPLWGRDILWPFRKMVPYNIYILVKTSNRTLYKHEYNRVLGFRFQCLTAIEPINQNIFNWYDFVLQYVIITFRQVIFSDASTSGF